MRYINLVALLICIVIGMNACSLVSSLGSSYSTSKEGFEKLGKDLESKFGKESYYTDITLSYDKTVGDMLNIKVAKDPNTLTMEEHNYMRGVWQKKSDITLEIEGGANPKEFMMTLDEAKLNTVWPLIEQSKKKLLDEKKLAETVLKMITIQVPDNGEKTTTTIYILLEPKTGGTQFSFVYDLSGKLVSFNY
jgi:hypothetical protein